MAPSHVVVLAAAAATAAAVAAPTLRLATVGFTPTFSALPVHRASAPSLTPARRAVLARTTALQMAMASQPPARVSGRGPISTALAACTSFRRLAPRLSPSLVSFLRSLALAVVCVTVAVAFGAVSGDGLAYAARRAAETAAVAPKKPPFNQFTLGVISGGAFGLWCYTETERENRREEKAVKEESERLERISKEFTNIEDGVVTDQDLMASLRSRLGNSTDSGEGGEGGSSPPPPSPPPPPPPPTPSGGSSAVLERPEPDAGPRPGASEADIERLKRMMGGSE